MRSRSRAVAASPRLTQNLSGWRSLAFANLLLLLGAWGLVSASAEPKAPSPAPTEAASPAPAAASPTPTPANPVVPLTEIAERSQSAIEALDAIEAEPLPEREITEVRDSLPEMIERTGKLQMGANGPGSAKTSLDELRTLLAAWHKVSDTLDDRGAVLTQRAKGLQSETAQVAQIDKLWQATEKAAQEEKAPRETLALVQTVLKAVKDAQRRLKNHQTELLELQGQLSAQVTTVKTSVAMVQGGIATAMKTLLVRDSVPLWQPEAQIGASRAVQQPESMRVQITDLQAYVRREWESFLIHAAIFGVLLAGLVSLRHGLHKWTEDEPHLKRAAPILEVPLATAFALSFVFAVPIYADAPDLLRAVLGALVLLPTIIILRRLLEGHLYPILYSLVVFFVFDQLRVATVAFPILNRWVLVVELLGAIAVFVRLIVIHRAAVRRGEPTAAAWVIVTVRLAVMLLLVAFGATVLGYMQLGTLLGTGVLRSGYCAVSFFALLKVVEGLTIIALRVRPLTASHIARSHRNEVQRQTAFYLKWAAVLGWLVLTLDLFQVKDTVFNHLEAILDLTLNAGAVHLSLGRALCFGGAIWLSVIISRLLRFFLSEEVYERVSLSPGLPYAISTILNYLVLLIGFLVALGLLGVDLTKVTIVAGAFSVGLGFGLQNIINNFVSGIILLFERPVKVGDVIQLGDSIGEVRRIGIRASIIRTREGSDIILPNGNLISNQVTNWTYSDRRRAIEIPFTIVAGPDPDRVMDLLKGIITAHDSAKGSPPAQAYITAITADKISLTVRAWTDRYEDWIQVRSELAVVLVAELARENIKLAAA